MAYDHDVKNCYENVVILIIVILLRVWDIIGKYDFEGPAEEQYQEMNVIKKVPHPTRLRREFWT
jgi:hypothetical protein